MKQFVHLHCHTDHSLLGSTIRIEDLCAGAKAFGMPAVALTDTSTLSGAPQFYAEAQKVGIKPIIGCEVCVLMEEVMPLLKGKSNGIARLILLAQDRRGYHNLLEIVSRCRTHDRGTITCVHAAVLQKYSAGLIALSSLPLGLLSRKASQRDKEDAIHIAHHWADIFPDRLYLEMQAPGHRYQGQHNDFLSEVAETTKLPLVATGPCGYLYREDAKAYEVLLRIRKQTTCSAPSSVPHDAHGLHFLSQQEAAAAFKSLPQALDNTLRIAETCTLNLKIESRVAHYPSQSLSKGKSARRKLEELANRGLDERLKCVGRDQGDHLQIYRDRLATELETIVQMGMERCFLVVHEYIDWAERQGISISPGRGSSPGSLVAWSLRITDVDPILHGLIFERFLNRESPSFIPTIETDFCALQRDKVLRHVGEQYGKDHAARPIHFIKRTTRSALLEAGHAMGVSPELLDLVFEEFQQKVNMTVESALKESWLPAEILNNSQLLQELFEVSRRLEGRISKVSPHAANLIISSEQLHKHAVMMPGADEERALVLDTQSAAILGLPSFTFLSLRAVTIIRETLNAALRQGKDVPNLETLPLDDTATLDLYYRGDTDYVFFAEGSGIRRYLNHLKPSCFQDIAALFAIYRPDPLRLGVVDEFIMRRHGQIAEAIPIPALVPVLKETYGIILYQEQIMCIAQILTGCTFEQADLIRLTLQAGDRESVSRERSLFVNNAIRKGLPKAEAKEVFTLLEQCAAHAFCKAHATAYTLLSYRMAFLKVHYREEFLSAAETLTS